MHTLDELTVRLLSELIEIAEGLGLKNAKKESKQDLIYKILDIQATLPESEVSAPIAEKEIKTAPKKRPPNANTKKVNNPKEPSQPTAAKDGTSKLLASLDLNLKDGDKKEDQPSTTNTPAVKAEIREQKPLNQEKIEKKPEKREKNERDIARDEARAKKVISNFLKKSLKVLLKTKVFLTSCKMAMVF